MLGLFALGMLLLVFLLIWVCCKFGAWVLFSICGFGIFGCSRWLVWFDGHLFWVVVLI